MLAGMKLAREKMDKLLNMGQTNPYDVPISEMTAQATHELKEHHKRTHTRITLMPQKGEVTILKMNTARLEVTMMYMTALN